MSNTDNREFEFRGVHHIALVCRDMAKTVEFYRDTLGMPLIKSINLPRGSGQHFFFDCGNGDSIAFFWFPTARPAEIGMTIPASMPTQGNFVTAHGSVNHIAIKVDEDKFDDYCQRLADKGVEVTRILDHDMSETQVATEMHDGVYVRSMYFRDPDGILLEFATWTKEFEDTDSHVEPVTAKGW